MLRMFGRNTVASSITFLLDLAILWALVEFASMPQMAAAAVAFVLPLILFYFLQRQWVFAGTERRVAEGLAYFSMNVAIAFLAMLAVFWVLLEFTALHYLLARLLASVVYGLLLFALNGRFNFKQL
jgi:putative flippase GtrA